MPYCALMVIKFAIITLEVIFLMLFRVILVATKTLILYLKLIVNEDSYEIVI